MYRVVLNINEEKNEDDKMRKLISTLFLLSFIAITNECFLQNTLDLGNQAPAINITDWITNVPSNQTLAGQNIVLEFWATWCGGCIDAVPHLNELQSHFNQDEVLFLSMTDESPEKVNGLLERIHFESTVVLDQDAITHANYGENGAVLKAIPKTILIDKKGIVRWIGHPNELSKHLIEQLVRDEDITFCLLYTSPSPRDRG